MRYIRFMLRVLAALVLILIAFVAGVFLPLWAEWFLHGDPEMPGGAGLVILGLPIGITGAVITGLFLLVRLHPWRELSK
jgi:hypothetical protein